MKTFKILGASLATALLLAACGGASTLSGSSAGPGKTSGTTSVKVAANPGTIAADGSTSATITAVARDVNNAGVAGVTMIFGASSGLITPASATTDTSGSATAMLSAAGTPAGTNITVAAAVGTVQGSASVGVVAIQESLTLSTSAPQVPSDSSTGATISALLKDANNNALPGIPVSFSVTSGVIVPTQTAAGSTDQVTAGTTDRNGIAAAMLTAGNDPTNRNITVTVRGGTAPTQTLPIVVFGTHLLFINGQPNLVLGASSTYTALLTDASGKGISNQTVTFVSANNTLSNTSAITDFTGDASVTLTASKAGTDSLTATALGQTTVQTVTVSSQDFKLTAPAAGTLIPLDTIPPVNLPVPVTVTWTSAGAPVANAQVTFSTTRGSILDATTHLVLANPVVSTDASGHATVAIASSIAGPATIAAAGSGVSAVVPVIFVAQTPTQISVQANPATIPINSTSKIIASVRDAQNNLVQGATVNFNLAIDPTAGSLSNASAVTNAQGQAQTIYTSSSTTSSANGVTITASVPGTTPTVTGMTTLSVGGQTVFLSLGTGNKINAPNTAQYEQDWAVQALDSHGGAVSAQQITVQILPTYYFKGFRVYPANATSWATVNSIPNCPAGKDCTDIRYYGTALAPYLFVPNGSQCANEDIGWTGIYVQSNDLNNNSKLDPGNVASVTAENNSVTDASGTLLLHVVWPQDHAYYVGVRLVALTNVTGTQSSTSADFLLPGLASDFNNPTVAPPGLYSPYGWYNSAINDCSDKR